MITTDDKNRLISLPEASELYGFSHSYLRTIAQKGQLQAQKVGTSWVTTPHDVIECTRFGKQHPVFGIRYWLLGSCH